MEPLTILLIVFISILFIGVIILLVFLLKKNKNSNIVDQSSNKEMMNQFENQKEFLNKMNNQLNDNLNDKINNLNLTFEKYKSSTSEAINKKMDEMKSGLLTNFTTLEAKVDNKLNTFNDQLSSYQEKNTENVSVKFKEIQKTLGDNITSLNERVEEKLKGGFKESNDQYVKVVSSIQQVIDSASEMDKKNKELTEKITSLDSLLNNSKSRGKFGEFQLETILSSVFGDTKDIYETQKGHEFKKGKNVIPDATLLVPSNEGVRYLCIDSKFPFSDYQGIFDDNDKTDKSELIKSFKSRLKDMIKKISNDYIVYPITLEYAVMFIPSDGIYAYIQTCEDFYPLIKEARDLNVVLTSPSTLQPILVTLKTIKMNYEISKNIKEVIKNVHKLEDNGVKLDNSFAGVEKALGTLINKTDELKTSIKSVKKITDKIIEICPDNEQIEYIEQK